MKGCYLGFVVWKEIGGWEMVEILVVMVFGLL